MYAIRSYYVETAGYAGLILNELLANSFTHAFPDNKIGEINITLETKPDNNIFLTYSDNGPGAEKIKPGEFQGMGTELVQILGEQHRITSYNVCYTKLLRSSSAQSCQLNIQTIIALNVCIVLYLTSSVKKGSQELPFNPRISRRERSLLSEIFKSRAASL